MDTTSPVVASLRRDAFWRSCRLLRDLFTVHHVTLRRRAHVADDGGVICAMQDLLSGPRTRARA